MKSTLVLQIFQLIVVWIILKYQLEKNDSEMSPVAETNIVLVINQFLLPKAVHGGQLYDKLNREVAVQINLMRELMIDPVLL